MSEDLLALRTKVAERVSESEAFRVIKVWRALWAKLTALGYMCRPALIPHCRSQPRPGAAAGGLAAARRSAARPARMARRLLRSGGAARGGMGYDAVARSTCARYDRPAHNDATARYSRLPAPRPAAPRPARSRVGRRRSSMPISASSGSSCTPPRRSSGPRGGTATAKGGRPWPPRPYTSDRLGIDFRHIRALVFGPEDQRQIQDMRRSGAVEAMRGDATADEAVGQDGEHDRIIEPSAQDLCAGRRRRRCAMSTRRGRRSRTKQGKKLQLQAAKKLQPK